MNVVITYSPNWLEYVKIEVYALHHTQKEKLKIYLLSDADGKPDKSFCDKYNIEFLDISPLFNQKINNKNVDTRFTKYTLYRLLLPEVIQEDRVLYIDADAIVNDDISDFYNMNIDLVAGVRDIGILPSQLKAIGLTTDDFYINAGILLLNLKEIRKANLPWIEEINSKVYTCHDQDVINKTCKGRITLVSNNYNSSLSTGFSNNIKIMHYAGTTNMKPWNGKPNNYQIWQRWKDEYSKNN
jgi:lipopolysaccharide biosynthesis glycosyltransferase